MSISKISKTFCVSTVAITRIAKIGLQSYSKTENNTIPCIFKPIDQDTYVLQLKAEPVMRLIFNTT